MVVLTSRLAESSSSSSTHDHDTDHRYDVFLSFKGTDTRNNFTDHLYHALQDANINTFLDEEEIETGVPLKPELENAIKSSRASIIVLSKNYAVSTWCLDELVSILEQKRDFNQIVIPIFYHVEPADLRNQQSIFHEVMAKHKQMMDHEDTRCQWAQKMDLWKMALTQVADLKGKDAKCRKETELIEEVVSDIHRRLGVPSSNTLPLLIGMDYYIKFINSWLLDRSCHTADILTIVGMSGIGKTSLAKYVFQLHSRTFQKSSFIEGINKTCNLQFNGLLDLQRQLHKDISKGIPLQVNDVSVFTSKIENALTRKLLFIVLDDIDSIRQLDALLGNKGLYPGSKIIITTKDASLTERCALFNQGVQPNHRKVLLNGLSETKSLELLSLHAFKSQKPKQGYKEVSKKLVKYCEGYPLALEVLGKSLYNLQDVNEWEYYIEQLMKEPHSCIKKALHMSFNSLPFKNDKDLFKHIACFFVGMDRYVTETILNACDINTTYGIKNLIDRCLLTIGSNNNLLMHTLVQEMGRDLVRQESLDKPWKRSRLWRHEESFKVLNQKKGKGNLLGLALDMRMLDKRTLCRSFELKTDSLSKMDNLMLLQLNYVSLNGSFQNFPEELRWLCMCGFPLKSIPLDLPMENLVVLNISYSNIESFGMWYGNTQENERKLKQLGGSCSKDKQLLRSLKILDLSFCEQLHNLGGFLELPALESLMVRRCINLIKVCESVEQCVELIFIDLSYCYKLKKIPVSMGKLKKFKTLVLDGCNSRKSQIKKCDTNCSDIIINSQTSSTSAITEAIPSDMKFFTISIPSSLIFLSLANNNLSNESFPNDFSRISMLEQLCLDSNPIISMPNCVRSLSRLEKLSMENCNMVTSIEHPPRTLKVLSIICDYSFLQIVNTSLRKIKFDPEMSPLFLFGACKLVSPVSFQIDGIINIQRMVGVEEKVLHSLGWKNSDFINIKHTCLETYTFRGSDTSQTKMYYEFGIFSTIYEGEGMPKWIKRRSNNPSISFTIPSSSNKKLLGLNFCCVEMHPHNSFMLPMIKISNITKNQTWIYEHYIVVVKVRGQYLTFLTHWMFGPNEMEGGDQITINVAQRIDYHNDEQLTLNCGVRLVYDDENIKEEDVLGYYKSWNHIIGGDLSAFQLTTGEYVLDNMRYMRYKTYSRNHPFIANGSHYKEEEVSFKAFSQKKSELWSCI